MNQESAINALILLQIVSFSIVYLEQDFIKKELKTAPLKVKVGRYFMFLLPTLTLLSILVKPLAS